jgi:uncharacterized protein with PIN domain
MRFWDSSAVAGLLVDEPQQSRRLVKLATDAPMLVWWATPVECMSALARREREGALSGRDFQLAAAMVAAERDPATLEFLSLDERLDEAASREGFRTER